MTVYLLHAKRPYIPEGCEDKPWCWMQHYLGWCPDGEVDRRIAQHRAGTAAGGSRVCEVFNQAGIAYELVRTWKGYGSREQQIKEMGSLKRRCPRCTVKKPQRDVRPRAEGTPRPEWALKRQRARRPVPRQPLTA